MPVIYHELDEPDPNKPNDPMAHLTWKWFSENKAPLFFGPRPVTYVNGVAQETQQVVLGINYGNVPPPIEPVVDANLNRLPNQSRVVIDWDRLPPQPGRPFIVIDSQYVKRLPPQEASSPGVINGASQHNIEIGIDQEQDQSQEPNTQPMQKSLNTEIEKS
jgi:hypothetical protein